MNDIQFTTYTYADLSKEQLYKLFKLRQDVFIVEQDCPYHDIDGKDFDSLHILGTGEGGELLAYARLLPKGLSYSDYVSVGRVIASEKMRGTGLGRKLMVFCMLELQRLWSNEKVKIQAQSHLLDFYRSYGFEPVGEEYLEDNIPHTDMLNTGSQLIEIRLSEPVNTRPCLFSVGMQDDSVFADFDKSTDGSLYLVRISFDGYGCCNLEAPFTYLSAEESEHLISSLEKTHWTTTSEISDILRAYFSTVRGKVWEDALNQYGLI